MVLLSEKLFGELLSDERDDEEEEAFPPFPRLLRFFLRPVPLEQVLLLLLVVVVVVVALQPLLLLLLLNAVLVLSVLLYVVDRVSKLDEESEEVSDEVYDVSEEMDDRGDGGVKKLS